MAMKVIIMPLYGIGDVLMSTPAVRNLKERLGAHITYLHMFTSTRDILINNPDVDESHHFPFLTSSKAAGLKFLLKFRGRYDASINFYPSNRRDYNLAAFVVGCPIRVGHRYVRRDLRELNFLKNRTYKEDDTLHNAEEDMRLLGFLGLKDPAPHPMRLILSDEEKQQAQNWLKEQGLAEAPLIGFHPGSSLFKAHAKKRWPAEKFSSLIDALSSHYPELRFLIFGGPEELELKEAVRSGAASAEKVLIVQQGSIRDSAALVARCKAFVANDAGLMHVAAALGVPTVGLFGPTNPVWLAPWKARHKAIRLAGDSSCGPCFRYSPIPQRCLDGNEFNCVTDIPVDEVVEAASEMLGF